MSYAKVLERLRAYEPKELWSGFYHSDGDCCALGAVVPALRGCRWEFQLRAVHMLGAAMPDVGATLRELGLSLYEAFRLQQVNDMFLGTPRARYAFVVRWLEGQVANECQAQTAADVEHRSVRS